MNILQEATLEMAFLKMGIYAEAKAGKTYTATQVAIGLHELIKSQKPIAFFDTETGSDFVLPFFQRKGIRLLRKKSKAFIDLIAAFDDAIEMCDILIVDSVTHPWTELQDSYMKKNNLSRISLRHWGPLKQTWREFTERYVNSKLHVIVCGRSTDIWQEVEDEDGSKESRKTGTKMRTETQMAYEPSLLVEMEAVQTSANAGGKFVHRAYIKGDRFGLLDGLEGTYVDNPTFESFLPHIQLLNLGGEHKGVDIDHDSQSMFNNENFGERRILKREILVEKIEAEIKMLYPGQTQEHVQARLKLMGDTFGTKSWKEIERLVPAEKLEFGLAQLTDMRTKADGGNGKPLVKAEEKPKVKPVSAKSKKGGDNAHVA
jgi:hypothetical protein